MCGGPLFRLLCVFSVAADKENSNAASFSVRYSFRRIRSISQITSATGARIFSKAAAMAFSRSIS